MNLFRSLAFAASAAALSALPAPAIAETVTRDANCYFFRDASETPEIAETCQLRTEGLFEGGQITHYLTWSDGVTTVLGARVTCSGGWMVDGRCGTLAFRNYGTFDELSDAEVDRHVRAEASYLNCINVRTNSVCWDPLQDI